MEERQAKRGLSRRHLLGGTAAAALLAAFPKHAAADLFGGDIGVLLAQLEQQLQLVSNAISTVQNLMASVERLNSVVQHGKQMLMMATGQGGLKGILTGVKDLADAGRGITTNLQTINVRGGQWKDLISEQGGSLTLGQATKLTAEVNQMNTRFIKDIGNIYGTYEQLKYAFEDLNSSGDAVREASGVQGVVGQMQLVGREVYQLSSIAARAAAIQTAHAMVTTQEAEKRAVQQEADRQAAQRFYGGYGRPQETSPTDVSLILESK